MKLAFKVLLLVILIVIAKMEKQDQIMSKPSRNLYSPVYSHNTDSGVAPKNSQEPNMQKISIKYNKY
ncbi:MAG: hypothetical protein JWQ14_181 [Adhaeribacter sp.]|nr:hypothetical protein [Adhaeribacter sp.]